jgi:hypothetical protein
MAYEFEDELFDRLHYAHQEQGLKCSAEELARIWVEARPLQLPNESGLL